MAGDLLPCPFCGGAAREPIDYAGFTGCSAFACPGNNVVALPAAWNRRPAPMEAVAWRWRYAGTNWYLGDVEPRRGADYQYPTEVQALAVIPTEGLGSSAEGADTHRVAETAVVAELQELREAASDVIKMLDLQLIAARHNNARGDHQWEPAGSTIERLRAAIKIGGRNDRP